MSKEAIVCGLLTGAICFVGSMMFSATIGIIMGGCFVAGMIVDLILS